MIKKTGIKSTRIWKFLSNVKLALKRMKQTSAYWHKGRVWKTFLYFMNVEWEGRGGQPVHSFRFNDIEFNLRPMEWHLMSAILFDEEYGLPVRLFEKSPPSLILDAGANVGMFSVYALSRWRGVHVYAVEPSEDTFQILLGNQNKNPALHWRVFQYAFWKEDGSVFFENEGASMAAHISGASKGVRVPAIRLDHFVNEYLPKDGRISLLKMDIEGAEEEVLKASYSILSRVDAMVIEVHSAMCDELAVRNLLKKEFGFLYDLSAPSTQYPVLLACRQEL